MYNLGCCNLRFKTDVMFALVDCNNFYASCERAFNPSLVGKPIVVLSNNDGCVIARSQEAKNLGIKMGAVPHLIADTLKENNVIQFSSNYTLYGDMSNRVMETLREYSNEVEVYSIDESFLKLPDTEVYNLEEFGWAIKKRILAVTGIPVGVGIGPTKTLAKVANYLAKKRKMYNGVYVMHGDKQRVDILNTIPIEDVWGIGRQHAIRLKNIDVQNAYEFTQLNLEWIRKNMSVVGVRMHQELSGKSCLAMEFCPPPKKGICSSRSFGKLLQDYNEVAEAVANYAARCGEKLRNDNTNANLIQVFLHTNPHRQDLKQYAASKTVELPYPTNSSIELIKYAHIVLKELFRQGYLYMKAGVMVHDINPASAQQMVLFDKLDHSKQSIAMSSLDGVNKVYGKNTLKLASMTGNEKYMLRCAKKSPYFTTNWNDIIKIKV
jgi:DNA polymerase V